MRSDRAIQGRTKRRALDPLEAGDRLAIRELIDAYARCADTRDAQGQMDLFTEDTEFLVYMDRTIDTPTQEIRGREALRPVFENLRTYEATTHFNGQSTVWMENDSAAGLSYCLAHHVKSDEGRTTLMVASIRYVDDFKKIGGIWYFKRRKLLVDWTENRSLSPAG